MAMSTHFFKAITKRHAGAVCVIARALVTMAYKPVALRVAAGAPDGTFQVVVAGDDVQHGKPDPEAYLTACARLGVDPANCVAVEDTLNGTLSAEAAGTKVLVIPIVLTVPVGCNRSRIGALSSIGLD
ncbi:MAG: HAD family hydrolase, partial [Thermomicrobiales bacterium]